MSQADEELQRIAEDARNTLPNFFRHVIRAGVGESHFCIKYPVEIDDDGNMEQVWIAEISFKDGKYYGVFANNPTQLPGVKKGDTVIFDIDVITDWMYVRGNKIVGGYSIKYLLEGIPENQRSDSEQKLLQMFY